MCKFLSHFIGICVKNITQDLKMQKEFLDLKAQIWGEVYQEYLEVRK